MGTSREDIRGWLEEGKSQGATHVIVVVDTFDYTDYPVYVREGQNVREVAKGYDGQNMQRIMEVYALHLDLESQLNEGRSFHYDDPDSSIIERIIEQ